MHPLTERFLTLLVADPRAAFREWFLVQEELSRTGEEELARRLADELYERIEPPGARDAKLLHDAAVFFGTPGPASSPARALRLFEAAEGLLDPADPLPLARLLHNRGNARQAHASGPEDLQEALSDYGKALRLRRDAGASIAAAATQDARGAAHLRLAGFAPSAGAEPLREAESALREALLVRTEEDLPLGFATSSLRLARVLAAAGRTAEARSLFERVARVLRRLGREAEASLADGEASVL